MVQGLGTPAPVAPTKNLVVTGLYRYVRNPIYVAVTAIILGQALLFGAWELVLLGAGFWLFSTCSSLRMKSPRCSGRSAHNTRAIAPTFPAGSRAFRHG